ncbi:MAG: hypothetical protein HC908_12380, partial [Calothrix sp. SM1_7_51]|nr:hypothetical protein [Calothrix sp. SM1_7_51]
ACSESEQTKNCKSNQSLAVNFAARTQKLKPVKGFAPVPTRSEILASHKPEILQQWKPSLKVVQSNQNNRNQNIQEDFNSKQSVVINQNTAKAQPQQEKKAPNLDSEKKIKKIIS